VLDPNSPAGAHADQRLRRERVAWLTTVNAAGQTQSSPIWFLWDGQVFTIYSRPRAGKLRNLARQPLVALHLADDGRGGDIVTIEGRAALAPDAPPADQSPEYLAKYRDGIQRLGMDPAGFARDYSQAIRVTPLHARVW
jgi:PPOX class probable F420-dependent enzyme